MIRVGSHFTPSRAAPRPSVSPSDRRRILLSHASRWRHQVAVFNFNFWFRWLVPLAVFTASFRPQLHRRHITIRSLFTPFMLANVSKGDSRKMCVHAVFKNVFNFGPPKFVPLKALCHLLAPRWFLVLRLRRLCAKPTSSGSGSSSVFHDEGACRVCMKRNMKDQRQ